MSLFGWNEEEAISLLETVERGSVTLRITEIRRGWVPVVRVRVGCALLKRENWEALLEVAGQMGVYEVIPLRTRRSVTAGERFAARRARFLEILARGCALGRCARLPVLQEPKNLEDLLTERPWWVLHEEGEESLRKRLREAPQKEYNLLIGPEGGWDPEETAAFRQLGLPLVRLLPNILRPQQALLVAMSWMVVAE